MAAADEAADLALVDVPAAAELARRQLDGMGDRWRHTQAVAAKARSASVVVEPHERDLLVAAGWLHDVGYAEPLANTGLHTLDGADYLASQRLPLRLVALVAHHSCARFEAAERGLTTRLQRYVPETGPVADALIYADMTTGPSGATLTVTQRLAEILERYPSAHPVHRAITHAQHELMASVRRTQDRLTAANQPM